MSALPFVIVFAIAWHFGMAVFEHRRRPEQDKPSMSRLLLLAEVEVLRSLRADLKRWRRRRGEEVRQRKLSQVENKLEELKGIEN